MFTPDNKINPVTGRDTVNSAEEKTKRKPPTGDFDKVEREVEQQEQAPEGILETLSKPKKKPVLAKNAQREETPTLTPFALVRGYQDNAADEDPNESDQMPIMATSSNAPSIIPDVAERKPIEYHHPLLKSFNEKQEEHLTRFDNIEQPDLATVSPFSPPPITTPTPITTPIRTEAVPLPHSLQEVIDQIVSKVLILKQSGDTETVIQLEGSFKGSRLIIQETNSAKGQLNITIDNLTVANQRLVEANRLSLVNDLLEKGIHVHMFIASATQESTRINVATNEQEQKNFRDNPQDNPRRDGKRQQSDDQT